MPRDLVIRAIVEAIENAPVSRASIGIRHDWIVRTRVLAVISGELASERFAFRVHSPARAGLTVGITYTIAATGTADGYTVDEQQWHSTKETP